MAFSTDADDKAKYKAMLTNWLISFVMIFILHYVIMIMLQFMQAALDLIPYDSANKNLEAKVMDSLFVFSDDASIWQTAGTAILFTMIVIYQAKFFFKYAKRFLKIGFLILIAPLITLTYSIDKASDNAAKAYKAWIKEITGAIFMQPVHALMYAIFTFSMSNIAINVPIVSLAFFAFLDKGEQIFNFLYDLNTKEK